MNPTLCVPDMLDVVPYEGRKIAVGDVIVYPSPTADINVTHRVVKNNEEGIRTRGDNNSSCDPYILKPENITGQVIAAVRKKRRRRIWGGKAGQAYCFAIRRYRRIKRLIMRMLLPFYHLLAGLTILKTLSPIQAKAKVVYFKNCTRLMLGKKVIGCFSSCQRRWRIFPPYKLFIDEAKLPC